MQYIQPAIYECAVDGLMLLKCMDCKILYSLPISSQFVKAVVLYSCMLFKPRKTCSKNPISQIKQYNALTISPSGLIPISAIFMAYLAPCTNPYFCHLSVLMFQCAVYTQLNDI